MTPREESRAQGNILEKMSAMKATPLTAGAPKKKKKWKREVREDKVKFV